MPFQVGQHAQVMIPIGEIVMPFESSIVAVEADCFEISVPRRKVVKYAIKPKQSISLIFPTPDGLMTMDAMLKENEEGRLLFVIPSREQLACVQRRAHERIPLPYPWDVRVKIDPDFGFDMEVPAQLKDLSRGGCSLWVDLSLMEGVPVHITVERPDWTRVRLTGLVAHSAPIIYPSAEGNLHRAGVRFDGIDEPTLNWLDASLAELKAAWQQAAQETVVRG